MAYLGRQPIVGNYQVLDALTATTTDTYALTKNSVAVYPQTPANCIVSLNGVIQAPFDSYTISGSNIVFASALTGSDSIDFITVLGDVLNVGTVSDGTISTAKLANGAVTSDKLASGVGVGKFESQLFHVRDEKANNTSGGDFTSGSWQTRTLNTVMTNEISGASLSSNQIILPAGTYFIYATAPAMYVDNHKAKLANITDTSDILIGTNEQAGTDGVDYYTTHSRVSGRFTLAAQKTLELQHRCSATHTGGIGYGFATNFSVVEVYSDVQIWKVA